MKAIFKRLILVSLMSLGLVKVTANEVKEVKAETTYTFTKVEENLSDWTGEYLIVYETGSLAFNGALTTLDAVNNYKEVVIDGKSIVADGTFSFFIEKNGEGYSIKSASGYYIFNSSDKNTLKSSTSIPSDNNFISYNQSDVDVIAASSHLRFNSTDNQMRFRYYKSSSYTGQEAIQLYKKEVVFADYTATLHYNDGITENGSITSVDGKFTAPETPTRTGYVFDGWYTDNETFENLFDFENTFATENIKLYAKWVEERDTYLQTTSFALGFDYSLNSGIINDASEVTNGLYTISAVVGDKYTVATNTLVTSSVGSNHVLSVNETTEDSTSILNHYTDLFYINKVNDKYTIQTMDGKYLTYGNTTSTELNLETEKTNNSEWTIENNTTTAPGTISIRKSDSFLLGYNTHEGRNEFGVCKSSYYDWYNLELTKIDVATSNYALRFGTEITTENYAKLGEVVSYGVLVAPTASLEEYTFKEWYEMSDGLEELVNTLDVLNITNAEMQTTETGYSFGGLLQNIPETQIHTSVSAACYVVNAAGEVFFAEQKDMSIVGAATYYAEHAAELGLNETETTLVNVLKGM